MTALTLAVMVIGGIGQPLRIGEMIGYTVVVLLPFAFALILAVLLRMRRSGSED